MKKKLLSLLLSIVIVLSLMPTTVFAAHKCPECDETIDGEPYCSDCYKCMSCVDLCLECGICTSCSGSEICEGCSDIEGGPICVECAIEKGYHCPYCEGCYAEVGIWCEECDQCADCADICYTCSDMLGHNICVDCAIQNEYHCPGCDGCYAEVGMWCEECGMCEDCSEICYFCSDMLGHNICVDCAADNGLHCPGCDDCYSESGIWCDECGMCENCIDICYSCSDELGRNICVDCAADNGLHCPNCDSCYLEVDWYCDSCGCCSECGDEYCDTCGLCIDCAVDQGLHCPECSACVEDDCVTICENCGMKCSSCADDFCEDCDKCSECVQICPNCGECSETADICPFCNEYCSECLGLCEDCGLCKECCRYNSGIAGCDCAEWVCVDSSEWADHFSNVHNDQPGSHEKRPAAAWSWDSSVHWHECLYCEDEEHYSDYAEHSFSDGRCTVCGYLENEYILILQQPKDVTNLYVNDCNSDYTNFATFTVKAAGNSALTFTWCQKLYSGGTAQYKPLTGLGADQIISNASSSTLKAVVPTECDVTHTYICLITDEDGHEVSTREAVVKPNHSYSYYEYGTNTPYPLASRESNGHVLQCVGEGCEEVTKLLPHVDEDNDRICDVCGYDITIRIIEQPKDVTNLYVSDCNSDYSNNVATFTVKAEGYSALTFTWCQKLYSGGTAQYKPLTGGGADQISSTASSSTLKTIVPTECDVTHTYICLITDEDGHEVSTREVVVTPKPSYSYYEYGTNTPYPLASRENNGHILQCVGEGCEDVTKLLPHVDADKDRICDICGYEMTIQILEQPKDVTNLYVSDCNSYDNNFATFTVKAEGYSALTFTWCQKLYSGGSIQYKPLTSNESDQISSTASGSTLKTLVPTECDVTHTYICIITDEDGNEVSTREAVVKPKHSYSYFVFGTDTPYPLASRDHKGHILQCVGEGCEEVTKLLPHVDEDNDQICDICGFSSAIIIVEQPKNVTGVSVNRPGASTPEEYATFSVKATGSSALTFTWCKKMSYIDRIDYDPLTDDGNTQISSDASGSTLRVAVPTKCSSKDTYICIITDEDGHEASSQEAYVRPSHSYSYYVYGTNTPYELTSSDGSGHVLQCIGDGCKAVTSSLPHVDEDNDQKCDVCGYNISIRILEQPQDVTDVYVTDVDDETNSNLAAFTVKAEGSSALTFTWCQKLFYSDRTEYKPLTDGGLNQISSDASGSTLKTLVPTDHATHVYICRITDEDGHEVYTRETSVTPKHSYVKLFSYDEYGHTLQCVGEGCEKKDEYRPHVDENEDGICDVCEYMMVLSSDYNFVIFNMNGHGAAVTAQSVKTGEKAAKPDDPSEDGWIFEGWYTSKTFDTQFNFDNAITEKTIIYAKWTESGDTPPGPSTYTIISGANGEWTKGSAAGLSFASDAPFDKFDSVKIDRTVIAAANYTAEAGSTKITLAPAYLETLSVGTHTIEIVSNDGSASTNFTVKSAEQPPVVPTNYTVTFNMNGHGDQVAAQTVNEGAKATKPADPTASGWTFDGWYADATFSAAFDFDTAIAADTTIYAKWTANSVTPPTPANYTVTFNMNGHGDQIASQSVESGSKATKPADPKASGYTFGGWYADATCSTKFDFNTAITANTTVYAKWTKNSVAPADPTTPQTGDTSNMFLWIALLLVSGGALVGTTVYGKKRKRAE